MSIFQGVYRVVRKIPEGKVTTYGLIAKKLGINPRVVGWALHKNPNSKTIPCYRVVNKDGRLASGFAHGGPEEQRERLLAEGVEFKDEMHVDLRICLWQEILSTKS